MNLDLPLEIFSGKSYLHFLLSVELGSMHVDVLLYLILGCGSRG